MGFEVVNIEGFVYAWLSLVIGTIMLFIYRYFQRPEIVGFVENYYDVIELAGSVILSIAKNTNIITPDEWSLYQQEAKDRKLDIRLIAALYEIGDILELAGIDIPERVLLHIIESEYARIVENGVDEPLPPVD